jgi:branched-chain amino acid transport system permease protein
VSSFAQNLLNALSLGALTALVALGLAMVFSIMNLINFAHGAIITLGGFAMLYGAKAGLPFALIVPLTVAVTTLAAVLMERIAFRPLRGASPLSLLLSSFAINALLQVVYQVVVSPRPRPVTLPGFLSSTVRVGSLDISVVDLCSIGASALALLVLTTFLRRSVLGIAMRAAAEDFPVTRLMGIRANRVVAGAFAASGALAAWLRFSWSPSAAASTPPWGSSRSSPRSPPRSSVASGAFLERRSRACSSGPRRRCCRRTSRRARATSATRSSGPP